MSVIFASSKIINIEIVSIRSSNEILLIKKHIFTITLTQ